MVYVPSIEHEREASRARLFDDTGLLSFDELVKLQMVFDLGWNAALAALDDQDEDTPNDSCCR